MSVLAYPYESDPSPPPGGSVCTCDYECRRGGRFHRITMIEGNPEGEGVSQNLRRAFFGGSGAFFWQGL